MDEREIQDLIRAALDGNEPACTQLVLIMTPTIHSRVVRGLFRWRIGNAAARDVRQEVEDFTQEILLHLFEDDGKVLQSWQPERGLSFLNFIGLVANRQTVSKLRNGKRSPWKEDPTLFEDFDVAAPESSPEEITASREQLELLLDRLVEELSPLGWHLFDLLFLRELSVEEVVRETGMSPDAIYQWRRRLRLLVERLLADMSEQRADMSDRRVEPRRSLRGEA